MTDIDTSAIRARYEEGGVWPEHVYALVNALDAARTEQLSATSQAVGDCCGYRTRAVAAEARIAEMEQDYRAERDRQEAAVSRAWRQRNHFRD